VDATGPSLPSYNEDEGYANNLSTLSAPTDDSCFNFDRNGVIIPYFAFVSLLDDPNFQQYLKTVVEKFEETEGPLSKLFQQEDLKKEALEEEEEDEYVDRRTKKTFGRNRKQSTPITIPIKKSDPSLPWPEENSPTRTTSIHQ